MSYANSADLPGFLVRREKARRPIPFTEARKTAARIPDARLVPLPSNNHVILEHEHAWARFLNEVSEFVLGPTAS